jgi:hypothetical protein
LHAGTKLRVISGRNRHEPDRPNALAMTENDVVERVAAAFRLEIVLCIGHDARCQSMLRRPNAISPAVVSTSAIAVRTSDGMAEPPEAGIFGVWVNGDTSITI